MKRRFTILTAAFALLAFLAIPMGMKGQTASFAPADFSGQGTSGTGSAISATVDGVTFACDKGFGTTQIRCYSGGTITISSSNTITAISFTFSGSYTGGMETSYTNLSTNSWTQTLSSQARITECNVSYSGGDTPQPTTYTVTFNAGDGTFVGNTDFPNASNTKIAGTYTLPSATPVEGYIFNGWNLGENTYEGGASYTVSGDVDFTASYTENTTPTPSGETATLNIQAYAEANNWTNSTKYTTAIVTPVTFTANGGNNTGKYYTSGYEWRYYQGENASITISIAEGYTLVSVTPTYNVNNGGVLKNGNVTIASGTTVSVSGTSVTFTVGNSGSATNGQVRFTNIDVVYVSDGGTQTASDLTIINTTTDLTFDLYNNATAQVISYTTSSTGAITITPAESNYFTYVHDATAKTITVAPTAVTPSAQTVTISQEADDDYYAGTTTFTVSVANSDPTIPGTINNPYTVAQARAAIDAGTGTQGVYVTGTVSENNYYSQSNHYITYFISADGSTESDQLEAFHGKGINGADFTSADDIQVGDIVVIYGNLTKYNITYELAEGNQLVSLERPTPPSQEYTLTVTASENVEIFTFIGTSTDPAVEGSTTQQVISGTEVGISVSTTTGYVLTLMVDGEDVTSDLDDTGYYTFTMPAHNVTVTATAAEVVPPTPSNWVLTSIEDLTEDDIFVIVGDNGETYAMSNDNGASNPPAAVEVIVAEGTLSAEPAANLQWNISITDDGYTFYPNGETETWLYCTNTNNGVRVGTNDNKVFTIEDGYLKNVATSRYVGIYNSQDWRCYTNTTGNIANQTFAFYKKVAQPATETHTLTINGYQNDENDGGYYLIASPVNVDPATVGMTTGDFDLYYFDEGQELEWRNYEATSFNLVPGKGYLYAKKATTEGETFSFELTGTPYSGNGTIDLTYTENAEFAGFNLIGNPFGTNANLDLPYYRLNSDGSALNTTTESSEINVMEGVFVQATAANPKANFTKVGESAKKIGQLNVKVTRNRSVILDNAIIRFDEGATLSKFQLNANSTKLYFTEGNQDFAVVRSANEGEMPVNFKAGENGTYTISIDAENVDVNYLHLIDNMTGADVDLLATPSYSFEAKVTDYASRFRLVFSANSGVNEQNSETFAFFNGNNLVINNEGEATLQVIDMMGRMISSEQIQGSYSNSLNLSAGVYVLRLSNGNAVKTQKIVID
jgi:hypothetical protein